MLPCAIRNPSHRLQQNLRCAPVAKLGVLAHMKHATTSLICLFIAFNLLADPLFAQSLAEPDVPTGLLERKGDEIVNAPPDDFALAMTYHAFNDKGVLVRGQRVTILAKKAQYTVGEAIRVLHVLEAVAPDIKVYNMGPKTIYDEYVDGKLATVKGPGSERYRGSVVDRPIADFNYEITTYTFSNPGIHTIQWKGGGHPIQGSLGLESNVFKLEIVAK